MELEGQSWLSAGGARATGPEKTKCDWKCGAIQSGCKAGKVSRQEDLEEFKLKAQDVQAVG